ncbi:hypothetical protein [Microbacterium sp. GXS0129]|uniref:hypothetical protein n=1 Tax=Microbacterium sp. GXS0129 TaxID=3377836 RepID=UPI00383B9D3C
MAGITTPVEGYTGVVVGVSFVDGHGETDNPAALAYFARQGYTIEDTAPAFPDGDPTEKWTGDQLKAFAAAKEITVTDGKKADVLKAITDALAERTATAEAEQKRIADEKAAAAAGATPAQ